MYHGFCSYDCSNYCFISFSQHDHCKEKSKLIKNLSNSIIFSMSINSSEITIQYYDYDDINDEKNIRSGDIILIYNPQKEGYLTCGHPQLTEALVERLKLISLFV
jgi:hypothetical protein